MYSEVKGNAWNILNSYSALCLTTNGTVTKEGKCVMGRGIALEAKNKISGIDSVLGKLIVKNGNVVQFIGQFPSGVKLFSFPVKHNWFETADINLIKESAVQLMRAVEHYKLQSVLLPRPGCGNGKLDWADVSKELAEILDERIHIVSF